MLYYNGLTYNELYKWGCGQLVDAGISESQLDARLLLEYCCGTDRNTLLVHGERSISAQEYENFADCIARRKEHIPLQQITGEQDFMGLTFDVYEDVLIPRQDTEVLVEEVMRHLHDGMRILDMCTGSGCILLSLLHYSNDCTGVGVDISEVALQAARMNAGKILGIKMKGQECADSIVNREVVSDDEPEDLVETGQKVLLIQSDLFQELDPKHKFDIIVSNPPYIKTSVIDTLMPEVREHEPILALDGREDGLFFYREIVAQAGGYLAGGGMLFFEIGYDQGEAVRQLMENAGYTEVEIVKDYAGLDRVVYGEYKGI